VASYPRDLVGYGGAPPDPEWPEGARLALNFVFNVEEGSEYSIPDGDGFSEASLTESPTSSVPHGERDLAAILASVQEGIYVTTWLGGNADMTTGDFSYGLRGFLVKGGEIAAPVSEMNVTGNYGEILMRLSEVGNDPVPWSSFRTPTLVFDDVQFSGS